MRVNPFFAIEFDQTVYYNALDKAFAQGGTGSEGCGKTKHRGNWIYTKY